MKVEDYDIILNKGWGAFMSNASQVQKMDLFQKSNEWMAVGLAWRSALQSRLLRIVQHGDDDPIRSAVRRVQWKLLLRLLSHARQGESCTRHRPERLRGRCHQLHQEGWDAATWVGGWRSATRWFSRKISECLVFPYFHDMVTQLSNNGIRSILHFRPIAVKTAVASSASRMR